jgi:hypothetical protein
MSNLMSFKRVEYLEGQTYFLRNIKLKGWNLIMSQSFLDKMEDGIIAKFEKMFLCASHPRI